MAGARFRPVFCLCGGWCAVPAGFLLGIPFVVAPTDQALVPIVHTAYGDESDPGPFPVPLDAAVEGGPTSDGHRHALVPRQGTRELFELYRAFRSGAGWAADSGARFDLRSNALRPLG